MAQDKNPISADDLDAIDGLESASDEEDLGAIYDRMTAAEDGAKAPTPPPAVAEAGEDEDQPDQEAAAESDDDQPADQQGDEDQPGDEIAAKPPEHWSKEDKDFLAALPDDASRAKVQEWRKGIERAADSKFQEAGEIRRAHEQIETALEPLGAVLQQHGISKADAVSRLVTSEQMIRADLGAGLARVAGQYGGQIAGSDQAVNVVRQVAQALGVEIGGAATVGGAQPGAHQAGGDKEQALSGGAEQPVQHQASGTNGAIDPAQLAEQAARRVWHEQQQAAAMESAQQALTAFTEAKGEDGQLTHPHYERVKGAMRGILMAAANANQKVTLEQAYEQSTWTEPELRQARIKADQEAAAQADAASRRSKAAKSQNARTPRSRGVSVPEIEVEEDMGKIMSDTYDRIIADGQ
ncbi:MAG TPA: hypothetical protein VMW68_08525 [Methyloceanibacter sp.]|nr:hypothetical protein [Methyloceanibacter sp.]